MHHCNCKFRLLLPTLSVHIDKSSFVLVTLALRSAVAVAVAVAGAANQLIICMPHTMPNIVNIYYNIYLWRGEEQRGREAHTRTANELQSDANQLHFHYERNPRALAAPLPPLLTLLTCLPSLFPFATCPN